MVFFLSFGRLWFALLGLTPRTCVALIPLFDLLIVGGLVRFAKNVRSVLSGILLLALSTDNPFVVSEFDGCD